MTRTTLLSMVEAIARSIRDGLPADEAAAFDAAVAAVATDRDLSRLPWQFLAAELRSLPPRPPQIQAVVDPVIAGLDQLAAGQEWPEAAAAATRAAAADVTWADAAAAAAKAVAKFAAADRVDPADRVAAADRVATAFTWAAAADAAAAVARRQRDLLLQLLAEA